MSLKESQVSSIIHSGTMNSCWGFSSNNLAFLLGVFFLTPIFLTNTLSVGDVERVSLIMNFVRVSSQINFFLIGLLFLYGLKIKTAKISYWYFVLVGIALLLFSISYLSLFANGQGVLAYIRPLVFLLYMVNYLILFKILMGHLNSTVFIDTLSSFFMYGVLLFSCFTIYLYLSNQTPFFRLGYPLIPGVFGFYCVIAFTIALFIKKNIWLVGLFLVMVLMSGSRSAMGLSFVVLAWDFFHKKNRGIELVVLFSLIVLSILCIPELNELLTRVLLTERKDISSGRFEIWNEALRLIFDRPFLGLGERPMFIVSNGLIELRAHNSFLELAAMHGVPFALLSYLVWIGAFYPRKVLFNGWRLIQNRSPFADFGRVLFWLVMIKSLVTTTFWTNMGDPAVHFVMLVLLAVRLGVQKKSPNIRTGVPT